MSPAWLNPDCLGGKHTACAGDAWDFDTDQPARCACTCHGPRTLRAITVRQPWAWAIVHGQKDVEAWRPILGYEGMYEVSSIGNVRSLPRTVRRNGKGALPVPERVLTVQDHGGYPSVKLCRPGEQRRRPIHVLVCEAWHGPRPDGMECRHLDDDKTNIAPGNLRWGTRSENMRDRVLNGIDPNLTKTHCKHGHEYSPENTHTSPDGRRYCRTCMREWNRRSRERRRAVA